jgi:hypothetical protein
VGNTALITAIDYTTNSITLAAGVTRNDGDSVWLYKKSDNAVVLVGTAPDAGANEYGGVVTPPSPGEAPGCCSPYGGNRGRLRR